MPDPGSKLTKEKGRFREIAKYGKRLASLENITPSYRLSNMRRRDEKKFKDDFFLRKFEISPPDREIRLYDQKKGNKPTIVLSDISDQVLNFQVSGYLPIYEWLKLHSQIYSRMEFNKDQLRELLILIDKIQKQLDLMERIDNLVGPLLSSDEILIPPIN